MGYRFQGLVVAFAIGCAPTPGPAPVDAGLLDDCRRACQRLAELKCPEAEPTPDGGTCVDVCWNAESSGYVTMRPACVAEITACDQIDDCFGEAP
jgi:hypothetical protein